MIRYLAEYEKKRSEVLYREAFPEDKDAFVEYYYSYVTKDNRILVVEQGEEICAMLHLNPYRLSVNDTAVDAYYYVAVATKAEYRHQGMMRSLLHRSLKDIHTEGQPFAYLMPADKAIYEPFDFRIVYQQKKVEIPQEPEQANEKLAELFDVFTLRDAWYAEKQLEEERVCAGDPPFDIVPYIMARITHVERMLELLRSKKPTKILLNVTDEIIRENNGTFLWEVSENDSSCRKICEGKENDIGKERNCLKEVRATVAELTEFVFGKRKLEGLDNVKVLSRICINEAV